MIVLTNPQTAQTPRAKAPAQRPPASPAVKAFHKLDVLGAATITDTVAALGVAGSQLAGAETPVLNFAMAGVHGLRSLAFLAAAKGKSGVQLQQRLGVAAGEGLMAVGNLAAGFGGGTWSIPLLLTGATVNLIADYRYRTAYEAPPGEQPEAPRFSGSQKIFNLGDAALTTAALNPCTSMVGGGLGALGHLGLAAACYAGKGGIAAKNTHSQHSKGYAHAMMAAGLIASAAQPGNGWFMLPVLAGALGTNLQDLRDSTL